MLGGGAADSRAVWARPAAGAAGAAGGTVKTLPVAAGKALPGVGRKDGTLN